MTRGDVTERDDLALFRAVLGRAVAAITERGLPYAVFGSIASIAFGRPEASGDIDILVRPQDAEGVLDALADAGFACDRLDPTWIYKAYSDGVLVDVIFRTKGDIHLDEEALSRTAEREYAGQRIRLLAPEDVVVIEAVSAESQQPVHWENALGVIARTPLDWEYLARRARFAARRVLSLLIYAQSNDLIVPDPIIRSLFAAVYAQ
jgi:hypothetical protein